MKEPIKLPSLHATVEEINMAWAEENQKLEEQKAELVGEQEKFSFSSKKQIKARMDACYSLYGNHPDPQMRIAVRNNVELLKAEIFKEETDEGRLEELNQSVWNTLNKLQLVLQENTPPYRLFTSECQIFQSQQKARTKNKAVLEKTENNIEKAFETLNNQKKCTNLYIEAFESGHRKTIKETFNQYGWLTHPAIHSLHQEYLDYLYQDINTNSLVPEEPEKNHTETTQIPSETAKAPRSWVETTTPTPPEGLLTPEFFAQENSNALPKKSHPSSKNPKLLPPDHFRKGSGNLSP